MLVLCTKLQVVFVSVHIKLHYLLGACLQKLSAKASMELVRSLELSFILTPYCLTCSYNNLRLYGWIFTIVCDEDISIYYI